MNIIFLTRYDPTDINSWSGTLYYIYHQLTKYHHIEIMGTEILGQLAFFTKENLSADSSLPIDRYLKNLDRLLSERINSFKCDLIFFGDLFFHPLDAHIPIVLCTDLTFEQRRIHFVRLDERNIERCIQLEKLSLNTAYRIIHTSEWIKSKTIEVYNINPNKIEVVELGANIPTPMNYSIDIDMDVCRLVFIGKNWEKKGGDKVLQAYKILNEEGFPCSLAVIGSTPKEPPVADKDLTIIPFLNKENKDHLTQLCQILFESHFLVLPTEFDAFGIVFCEASAYGVPSIASDVGGVGQPVKEGKNGYLLPPDATAQDYANKIKTVFSDKESYIKLRASSRREFETRLNWDVWGERVNAILEDVVNEWKIKGKDKNHISN